MFDFDRVIDRRSTNSVKWQRYGEGILPLWIADMDFPAPEPMLDILRRSIEHGVLGYEFPTKALKETVAGRMEKLYGWTVSPESIIATPGVVAGFVVAAHAVCQKGEGVLIQPPIYPPFLSVHEKAGLWRQTAPLHYNAHGNTLEYSIDWDVFKDSLNSGGTHTSMFLLCNPHNPTGRDFSNADLTRMAEICLRNEIIICSDEIHAELLLGETKHIPIASLAPEVARRTITLIAPSKTFNIAGLFCGFAIVTDAELRENFIKVMERMVMHVNSLGLIAAKVAFSGECDDWLTALCTYLKANRDFLVDFIQRELKGIKTTVPEATYMAWLDCRTLNLSPSPYKFFLDKARVALNDGVEFGSGSEGFVRLNFGCTRKVLEEALEKIRHTLL